MERRMSWWEVRPRMGVWMEIDSDLGVSVVELADERREITIPWVVEALYRLVTSLL